MGNNAHLTSILVCGALVSVVLFNNCSEGFKSSIPGSIHNSSNALPGGGGLPVPQGNVVMSTGTPAVSSELNQVKTVSVNISRSGAYANKAITLKVETPEIDAIDSMDGVKISVTPTTLQPGQNSAEVKIDVGTLSPSFAEHFHLEAWDGSLVISELEVDVTVQPVFRIQIAGTGDANWSSNGKNITALMPAGRDIPFVHHPAGLQVIFENLSTASRIIHSSGSIPHQNQGMPLPASPDGVTVGGRYMPNAIVGTQISNAPVYLHNDENSGAARRLLFNVDL